MASADAIEGEWWLEGEETGGEQTKRTRKRTAEHIIEDRVGSKKKARQKKSKLETIESELVSPDSCN